MASYSTEQVRQISINGTQECLLAIRHLERKIKENGPFREDPAAREDALYSAMYEMSPAWREMILRQVERRENYERALSICALEEELGNPEGKLVLLATELKHAQKEMEQAEKETAPLLTTAEFLMKTDLEILEQQKKNIQALPSKNTVQQEMARTRKNMEKWCAVLRASTQLVWKNVPSIKSPDNILLVDDFLKEAEKTLQQHEKTPDDLNCAPVFLETKLSVTLTHYETFRDLDDNMGMTMALERMERIVQTICDHCPQALEEPNDRTIAALNLITECSKPRKGAAFRPAIS